MIHLYNDGDYAAAKARKKKLLAIYFIVLGVLFAYTAILFYLCSAKRITE